jgi:uncharacterized protein (DUF305 family)
MEIMMNKMMTGLSAVALVASLAACSGADEPANNVAANDMNAMMADPNNPFAQSEMTMDQAINAAVGVSAADTWVRKMTEHHKGAVDMSRIALAQSLSADAAMMARQTIDKQTKEIADLQKLVATGTPDTASGDLYRAASMQMHESMMTANGADISETYLRKMLAHHQGAVAMSDVALANGATGAVRAQIEKTRADQQKEVAMVEAMLRGEPMPTATPAADKAPETAPLAKPAAPKPAAAKPTPAKPKADPAPKPKAPTPPTCLPEHRAAGHC